MAGPPPTDPIRLRPAVFLDRDGTLNREVDFLRDPAGFELLPGAADALREMQSAGYLLVVVTNQSGIARGYLDEGILARIHERMAAELGDLGVHLDHVGHCPHHPTEGEPPFRRECDCRKPRPGLFVRAMRELGIDPATSWCVGDSVRDLEAGDAVGIQGILVRTGKGAAEEARLRDEGRSPEHVVDDLRGAAELVLAH